MFLAGASSITVGSSETFTLDRAALASELQDEYLQDSDFWREVIVQFRKDGGQQRVIMSFRDSDQAQFVLSGKAQIGTWKLENVAIIDHDYGREVVDARSLSDYALYDVEVTSI